MSPNSRQILWGVAGFFGLFAGLCAIFVLVVTAAQAWQEHAQAQWPEATAHVDKCTRRPSSTARNRYYIDCNLSYAVGTEQLVTSIYSGYIPTAQTWQYPRNQIAPFEEWLDAHPAGSAVGLRYDPGNHKKVALAVRDMPRGGLHTPNNLKLLAVCATACLVLLTIARIARPAHAPEAPASPSSARV